MKSTLGRGGSAAASGPTDTKEKATVAAIRPIGIDANRIRMGVYLPTGVFAGLSLWT